MKQIQALPQVPPSLKSKILGDLLGVQRFREQGAFRFSETPEGMAYQRLLAARNNRQVTDSANSATQFEQFIGGGYR